MKGNHLKALSFAAILIFAVSMLPLGESLVSTQSYTSSFLLSNKPDGDLTYELNVTIPRSLYQYYYLLSHSTFSDKDLAKFVTPFTLKPIADKLWQIYNNTEDFTNGVLMLVHQITYQEVIPGKYPIETLVDGYGDCDLFAYIAASILIAGGVSTILIFYRDQLHMEIGVDLGAAPMKARVETHSVNYRNISYYIGECTGSQWRTSWRIGETPSEYQNVSLQVVPLENTGQTSFEQVSVTLNELEHSALSLKISPFILLENSLIINGQILPQTTNENVTLNVKTNGWTTIGVAKTRADGRFTFSWVPSSWGVLEVQASWVGNNQYNGATSAKANVVVLPLFFIVLVAALLLVIVVFAIIVAKISRRGTVKNLQLR